MPEQAPRPVTLIRSLEIMKLGVFTNLNKRRNSAFPKGVTFSTTAEPAWHGLFPNPCQKKTIPHPTNQHTPVVVAIVVVVVVVVVAVVVVIVVVVPDDG